MHLLAYGLLCTSSLTQYNSYHTLAWRHVGSLIPQQVRIIMANLVSVRTRWGMVLYAWCFLQYFMSLTPYLSLPKLNLFSYDEGISQRLQDIKDLVDSGNTSDSAQCCLGVLPLCLRPATMIDLILLYVIYYQWWNVELLVIIRHNNQLGYEEAIKRKSNNQPLQRSRRNFNATSFVSCIAD